MLINKIRFIRIDKEAEIIKAPYRTDYFTTVEQMDGDRSPLFSDLIEKLILDINGAFHYIRSRVFAIDISYARA
jgi:hypothetical protein